MSTHWLVVSAFSIFLSSDAFVVSTVHTTQTCIFISSRTCIVFFWYLIRGATGHCSLKRFLRLLGSSNWFLNSQVVWQSVRRCFIVSRDILQEVHPEVFCYSGWIWPIHNFAIVTFTINIHMWEKEFWSFYLSKCTLWIHMYSCVINQIVIVIIILN